MANTGIILGFNGVGTGSEQIVRSREYGKNLEMVSVAVIAMRSYHIKCK